MKFIWTTFFSFLTVMQCHATITWLTPPNDISMPTPAALPSSDFQAGLDASGNGVVVWVDIIQNHVQSNTFISGVWSTPFDVSGPGAGTLTDFPVVAVAANGNAVAIWVDTPSPNIHGAMKPFGAAWTVPVLVSTSGLSNGTEASVGVDANGNAVAVWVDGDGEIFAATMPFGGAWTVPVSVSVGVVGAEPQVAVAANGNAVAVWRDATLATGDIFSSSLASGVWSLAPLNVSSSIGTGISPRIGVDAVGNAVATWHDLTPLAEHLYAATLPFGAGAWAAPVDVSGAPATAPVSKIAVNASGIAVAVWVNNNTGFPTTSRMLTPGVW